MPGLVGGSGLEDANGGRSEPITRGARVLGVASHESRGRIVEQKAGLETLRTLGALLVPWFYLKRHLQGMNKMLACFKQYRVRTERHCTGILRACAGTGRASKGQRKPARPAWPSSRLHCRPVNMPAIAKRL